MIDAFNPPQHPEADNDNESVARVLSRATLKTVMTLSAVGVALRAVKSSGELGPQAVKIIANLMRGLFNH